MALPQLKLPGKSISNWEVMERVKAMVAPEQFSALRLACALAIGTYSYCYSHRSCVFAFFIAKIQAS